MSKYQWSWAMGKRQGDGRAEMKLEAVITILGAFAVILVSGFQGLL